jgi:hypothetical protein
MKQQAHKGMSNYFDKRLIEMITKSSALHSSEKKNSENIFYKNGLPAYPPVLMPPR